MKKILLTILATITLLYSFAQNGYNWGESKKEGQAKYQFININYKTENYKATMPRIQWLINDCPDVHKNLYIWGAAVYKRAAKEATVEADIKKYQDSTLFMYDQQMKLFGMEAEASNYKGLLAYKYLSKRENTLDELFELYTKIIELNDTNTFEVNAYYYLIVNLVKYSGKGISEEQLLNAYQTVNRIYDYKKELVLSQNKSTETIDSYKKSSTQVFEKYYDLTCESIDKLYGGDLDVENAKKAKKLLETEGCTGELYLKVLTLLNEKEPNEENAMALADYYNGKGKRSQAIEIYTSLLATSNDKKVLTYKLMKAYKLSGNKQQTVKYAKECINLNYKKQEAGLIIGNLYYNSLDICRVEDVVQTRTVFIAAYKYYEIAGNTQEMAKAKAQFPSSEEVFLAEKKVGETISTGCWINEKVTIQVR